MTKELARTLRFIALLLVAELALLVLPAWAAYPAILAALLLALWVSVSDLRQSVRQDAENSEGFSVTRRGPARQFLESFVAALAIICVGLFFVYG